MPLERLGAGKHIFTHIEWHMTAMGGELGSADLPEGWFGLTGGNCGISTPSPMHFKALPRSWLTSWAGFEFGRKLNP